MYCNGGKEGDCVGRDVENMGLSLKESDLCVRPVTYIL